MFHIVKVSSEQMSVSTNEDWTTEVDEQLPVLKANCATISINDGDDYYRDAWEVHPEIHIDEFVAGKFKGEKVIRFFSDIDTLSFTVTPDKEYDFVVMFEKGIKAYTRISTEITKKATFSPRKTMRYTYKDSNRIALRDTIPFRVGDDNGIHITGKINNSAPLDFLFDTGADCIVVTSSIVAKKVNMKIYGEVVNGGSDGIKSVPVSLNNKLTVGHLQWDSVKVLSIGYDKPNFDVVLGWVAFEDKIVEIDYDNHRLIIHDEVKEIPDGFSKLEIKMIGGIPYIRGVITVEDNESNGWFEYDSGSNGSLGLSRKFADENKLSNALKGFGKAIYTGSTGVNWEVTKHILPKLKLGGYEIHHVPVSINLKDPKGISNNNILGNNLLKRFNAIIDFKNYVMYIKPNDVKY